MGFGEDVDSEEQEEEGVMWAVTRGVPPSISRLEASLSDVKALYEAKFGEDVDSEAREEDGVMWSLTRGVPPTISQLEASLSDVKALYEAKFGKDVDSEDRDEDEGKVEKDDVPWIATRGVPPSISQLEDSLSDAKAL